MRILPWQTLNHWQYESLSFNIYYFVCLFFFSFCYSGLFANVSNAISKHANEVSNSNHEEKYLKQLENVFSNWLNNFFGENSTPKHSWLPLKWKRKRNETNSFACENFVIFINHFFLFSFSISFIDKIYLFSSPSDSHRYHHHCRQSKSLRNILCVLK